MFARQLGRMGAPYGQYLLDDVLAGRVHARLYVMLNAWRLTEQERTMLVARLRGSTVIWCYAPGYFDGDRTSRQAMRQLTGFELASCPAAKALASPTAAGVRLGLHQPVGLGSAGTSSLLGQWTVGRAGSGRLRRRLRGGCHSAPGEGAAVSSWECPA